MLRSQVNKIIEEAIVLLWEHKVTLPGFAYWTPEQWASKGAECDSIRLARLGWDITDFGTGEFEERGLLTFTARNGCVGSPGAHKPYAEKWLILREGQTTPMHRHGRKMEDIICRNGGNLLISVYNGDSQHELSDTDVEVQLDGVQKRVPAGEVIRLRHGESITLPTNVYHEFWAEQHCGSVIAQAISSLNDDQTDNQFLDPLVRFTEIIDDEPAKYLLSSEYLPANPKLLPAS